MTAFERVEAVAGALDSTLPYWFRHLTEPVAYIAGFVAGLIDIFTEARRQ